MRVRWREVFKFLAGAAFAGSIANGYLWLHDISLPVFGYVLAPRVLGMRAIVQIVVCIAFVYLGWFRKQDSR